jgi:hypothetical protein
MTTLIVKADGSGQFTDVQSAITAASNGDIISIGNGTYSSAGLVVDKEVTLLGESQSGVLLQDSRSNSQTFMNVSVNNVTLQDLTVRHVTSDSSIGIAISASGPGFPQVRLNNFKMLNVKVQYSKGGLAVRSDNFLVEGCTFEISGGSSTRRGILHYGNGGVSVIKNCHFINGVSAVLRAICPTSTSGSNPSDNQAGSLTIEGSTFTGLLSQFVNMDNHQGLPGAFELIVKNNVTPESNAFVVSYGASANFGDVFSKVTLIGNTLTNNHSSGLGKGMFAIDGVGPVVYRSSPLPVEAFDNTLGQLLFRTGYVETTGSVDSVSGYNTAGISSATIVLTGDVPELVVIEQENAGDPVALEYDVTLVKALPDVSSDPVFSDEANWRLIGYIFKHTASSKRMYVGIRSGSVSKDMKLRTAVSGEEYELDKIVISALDKTFIAVGREGIAEASNYDITLK